MIQCITRVGIDLAKQVFQVCATDASGHILFNRAYRRAQLREWLHCTPPCEVVMEACATAHYWARQCQACGHEVKLIHPAFVRPYVKTNKNDAADAEALCEAASRPQMRYVQPKTREQQDIQLLHRQRERLVAQRTALCNQTRGLLAEYGLVVPQGVHRLRQALPNILEDADNELTPLAREAFKDSYDELLALTARLEAATQRLAQVAEDHALCRRLMTIPGVGPMVATALMTVLGEPAHYHHGREFAAFLGLVPRQHSSGGKACLKGISKRGDPHLRRLLVQGAQAALRTMPRKDDKLSRWACALKQRKPHSVAVVALANKLARISWALAHHQSRYHTALA